MTEFAPVLIAWQRQFGRSDLPWQNTRDPYRIWLSEIMLQQTQVASVIPYFQRFLQKFPDNATLAAAPQEEVLGYWAGLGYYARARNLHRCARQVEQEYGGRFPTRAEALVALPGIGRSTAAAIAVFSTGAREAILDGNVKRVLTRCFGVTGYPGVPTIERALWSLAECLLPEKGIEAYTQGLMDLGASLCSRTRPQCDLCPLASFCVARCEARTAELPTPKPRKAIPVKSARMALLAYAGSVLVLERPSAGVWGGLWSLPELGPSESLDSLAQRWGCKVGRWQTLPVVRHAFTHFRLEITPTLGHVEGVEALASDDTAPCRWLALDALETAPLPAPVFKLLRGLRQS